MKSFPFEKLFAVIVLFSAFFFVGVSSDEFKIVHNSGSTCNIHVVGCVCCNCTEIKVEVYNGGGSLISSGYCDNTCTFAAVVPAGDVVDIYATCSSPIGAIRCSGHITHSHVQGDDVIVTSTCAP